MHRIEQLPVQIREQLGRIERIEELPQGCTSRVLRVISSTGDFVVKSTTHPLYSAWLEREHRILQILRGTRVAAPVPHTFYKELRDGKAHCWLVMDWLAGDTAGRTLLQTSDPEERAYIFQAVGHALRTLHNTATPAVLMKEGDWLEQQLADAAVNLENGDAEGDATLLAWLREQELTPVQQCLIHGDFTVDNVLVQDGRVTGIIDWSGGAYGDPRYDLVLFARPHQEEFKSAAELDAFFAGYGSTWPSDLEMRYFEGLYDFS